LAWRRVEHEIVTGTLGGEFEKAEKAEVAGKARDAEESAKDEILASYRFVVLSRRRPRQRAGKPQLLGFGGTNFSHRTRSRLTAMYSF